MWTTLLLLGQVWLVLTVVAGAVLLLTTAVQSLLRRPRPSGERDARDGTPPAAPPLEGAS